MIKLVITDLDGTFLNNQGDFDRTLFEKTKRVMEEQHVAFAICTGKQCERVEALFGEDAKDFDFRRQCCTYEKERQVRI